MGPSSPEGERSTAGEEGAGNQSGPQKTGLTAQLRSIIKHEIILGGHVQRNVYLNRNTSGGSSKRPAAPLCFKSGSDVGGFDRTVIPRDGSRLTRDIFTPSNKLLIGLSFGRTLLEPVTVIESFLNQGPPNCDVSMG